MKSNFSKLPSALSDGICHAEQLIALLVEQPVIVAKIRPTHTLGTNPQVIPPRDHMYDLLNRSVYSPAVMPITRRNVLRIESADRKPHASSISLSPSEELSIICCAPSTRIRSIN